MADDQEVVKVVKRLERYGKGIARKLLRKYELELDSHWAEDIAQSLLLEGWKVWRDTGGNEGLARHRMSSRATDEEEKLNLALGQPRPDSAVRGPSRDGYWDGADEDDAGHGETTERPFRRVSVEPDMRSDVLDELAVEDYFERLPEPQRKLARCRAAGMTVEEMMKETGLNRRTVERELAGLKKGLEEAKDDE